MNLTQCEPVVQQDVLRRCADWFESGGNFDDPYIQNQYLYTCRHLEIMRAKDKVDNHS